jgi:hypothetical protein
MARDSGRSIGCLRFLDALRANLWGKNCKEQLCPRSIPSGLLFGWSWYQFSLHPRQHCLISRLRPEDWLTLVIANSICIAQVKVVLR